jgi:hypothetical protein
MWGVVDLLEVCRDEYFFIIHLLYAFCAEARNSIRQGTVHDISLFPYRFISFSSGAE